MCMNMDPAFVAVYGTLNQTEMALCGVADPFKAQALNAGYAGHVLKDIPVMKLDTTVGGVANPTMGAASISITNYDLSTNGNVGMLNVGDWVMVGHPTAGEPFRVRTAGPTTLGLGSVADYTVPASLTVTALQVTACLPRAFVTVGVPLLHIAIVLLCLVSCDCSTRRTRCRHWLSPTPPPPRPPRATGCASAATPRRPRAWAATSAA